MMRSRLAASWGLAALSLALQAEATAQEAGSPLLADLPVIADRRGTPLQQAPVAATVLSGQSLERNRIATLAELQYYAPSLVSYANTRDGAILSIRGQGGFTPAGTASVTAFLNEVPGTAAGPGLHYDLDSVQILRGPQGVLFGRNTTGGAILYQTRRPDGTPGGHVAAAGGNRADRELDLALNLPLAGDRLRLRLAGAGQQRDGLTRTTGGKDRDDRDWRGGRASLAFRPTDGLENLVVVDLFRSRTHETGLILAAVNPGSLLPRLFGGVTGILAQQQALEEGRQVALNTDPFFATDRRSVTDILEWQAAPGLTVRNIFGYAWSRTRAVSDGDGTSLPVFETGVPDDVPLVQRQISEEAQVHGQAAGGRLTWLAGGQLLSRPADTAFASVTSRTLGQTSRTLTRASERSRALYAQGEVDLSDWAQGVGVSAGLRYSWDRRYAQTRSFFGTFCALPGGDASCTVTGSGRYRAPSWNVGVTWKPDPDTLLYVTSRRGYRTGGLNLQSRDPAFGRFGPERVTDVELGAKLTGEVLGRAARANLAGYLQKYRDIQFNGTVTQFGIPTTVTVNAARATVMGLEAEGSVTLAPWLGLVGNYTWTMANFDRFDAPVTPANVAGYHWTNVPRHKFYLGAVYTAPVDPALGSLSLSVRWAWQGRVFISANPDPFDTQDAYSVVNVSLNWDSIAGRPVDLSLFVTNLADKRYLQGVLPLYNALGFTSTVVAEPRMWGARLRWRFGSEGGAAAAAY